MKEIETIERSQLREDIIPFQPGDTIKVTMRSRKQAAPARSARSAPAPRLSRGSSSGGRAQAPARPSRFARSPSE